MYKQFISNHRLRCSVLNGRIIKLQDLARLLERIGIKAYLNDRYLETFLYIEIDGIAYLYDDDIALEVRKTLMSDGLTTEVTVEPTKVKKGNTATVQLYDYLRVRVNNTYVDVVIEDVYNTVSEKHLRQNVFVEGLKEDSNQVYWLSKELRNCF